MGECYDECISCEQQKLWSVLPALFWASNVTSNLQPLTAFHLGHLSKILKADNLFGEVVRCAERHLSSLITFLPLSEPESVKASTELKKILLRH